jgi:processive 1,2-diacylglycerol beta-glucosyltransferase
MVKLYGKKMRQYLGRITEEELQFLVDNLEEESWADTDYYINRATPALLKEKGMSGGLAELTAGAMGGNNDIEMKYEGTQEMRLI